MCTPRILESLHPLEYEHPFDTMALDTLQATSGLDILVRQFNKHAIERIINVQCTGSNMRVTAEGFPKLHKALERVCQTIHYAPPPRFYLERNDEVNGFTIGVDQPIIVLTSGAIDLLDESELYYLIGHEVGHLKSCHVLYHQIASFLPLLADITLGFGKLLTLPLQSALLHWSRMSEFTADRAGLLACQNIDSVTRVMMKIAGLPEKYFSEVQPEVFIQQAKEFERFDYEGLNKVAKFFSSMGSTHPWTVMRAAELVRWMEQGEYERIVQRETAGRSRCNKSGDSVFCRGCGYRLEGGERFCPLCGSQLCN